tara:strand:+ start:138 stop:620 length:483 start_codon:yes stop_codon:yes gene_type:complete
MTVDLNMHLTLEIEEGYSCDNLIKEIETKYHYYLQKANEEFKKTNYEQTLKYYKICIELDPDNTNHIRINHHLNTLVNTLLKKYIDCSYHSFNNHNYNISKYYIIKSLSLMIIFNEKIKKNILIYQDTLNQKLHYINKLNNDDKHNVICDTELYHIKLKH